MPGSGLELWVTNAQMQSEWVDVTFYGPDSEVLENLDITFGDDQTDVDKTLENRVWNGDTIYLSLSWEAGDTACSKKDFGIDQISEHESSTFQFECPDMGYDNYCLCRSLPLPE
jgi:hypothetical protein